MCNLCKSSSIFLLPLDFNLDSKSTPANSCQFYFLSLSEDNFRWIKSWVQFYLYFFNISKKIRLSSSWSYKKCPFIFIIFLCIQKFCLISYLKFVMLILFQVLNSRFHCLRISQFQFFLPISHLNLINILKFFPTEWAHFMLIHICGFINACLTKNMLTSLQLQRFIQHH